MLLGSRLKVMLADLGLNPDSAGKMLHVNPRTVRYWISGKTLVPYAAYRLLRILSGSELPATGWDGWHMHSGRLWSPEGHSFTAQDSAWWSLLVRQARCFKTVYDRNVMLELSHLVRNVGPDDVGVTTAMASSAGMDGGAATSPTGYAGRAAKPTGLNLSHQHFGTPIYQKGAFSLENGAYSFATQSIAKGSDHAL
jgi:hypothetical protein